MTTRTWFPFYSALLLVAACGDAEAPAIRSGLASDKLLTTLTPEEAFQLCDATGDVVSEFFPLDLILESACSVVGSSQSVALASHGFVIDQETCELHRDECLVERRKAPVTQTSTCDLAQLERSKTCVATVAEYERCATAKLRAGAMYIEEHWTCAGFAAQGVSGFNTATQMNTPQLAVPECEAYEAKCGPFNVPEFE